GLLEALERRLNERAYACIPGRQQRRANHIEGDARHVPLDIVQGAGRRPTPCIKEPTCRTNECRNEAHQLLMPKERGTRLSLPLPIGPRAGEKALAEQRRKHGQDQVLELLALVEQNCLEELRISDPHQGSGAASEGQEVLLVDRLRYTKQRIA